MKGRRLKRLIAILVACSALCAAQAEEGKALRVQGTAITFPDGETVTVRLGGTARLLGSFGEAKVTRRLGNTELDIKLEGMKPALSFGGDFNTFVLWTISPEGLAFNTGEFVLRGAKSELKATTPLVTFAIFVTAEPHLLVKHPSGLFVLMNTEDGLAEKKGVTTARFEYSNITTGYAYKIDRLTEIPPTDGTLRTERYQALLAVALARKVDASRYAPEEFARAQAALEETQQGFKQGMEEKRLTATAQQAIRSAVVARQLAEERAAREALDAERRAAREEEARLSREKQAAEDTAARATLAAERARSALEKSQAGLKLAEEAALKANVEADRLAREKLAAVKLAESAREQETAMHLRLGEALKRVAETRETERGLVVTLPGDLFEVRKPALRPKGREILSRIAGILLVIPEYRISVEGHTDTIGRSELNQRLSEDRAVSVGEFLVEAQFSPALITARGFGETRPVAPNLTEKDRGKNRRVEIVIEGLTKTPR